MNAGLVRLALRRALAPGVLAASLVVLLLALRGDWAGGNALLEARESGRGAALVRAMTREGVWSIVALAILPLLVVRAARIVGAWKSGEGEWLASRAAGRATILLSTWIGTWIGGALLLAAAFVAIELRVRTFGPTEASDRLAGSIALPPAGWIDAATPRTWTVRAEDAVFPAGARARVELAFGAGSGRGSEIELRARRAADTGSERVARARIASRGTIEIELPQGSGDLAFEVSCLREGARAYLASDSMDVSVPCASDVAAGGWILLRLVLALAAWSALAIGLGAWTSPASASLALLAAWIPAWFAEQAPAWLPGADLFEALAIAGRGSVPAAVDPRTALAAAALAATGLALASAGLRRWRVAH